MELKDVAVLITGGGSGLGEATARAMAAKGAKIGVIDQNKENAEKVAAEVKGVALHADVTDEEAIKAARQWRFRPGTRFGQPVAVYVKIAVGFAMR